ncbi:calcium uptake protein, mitochondrial-like isoform X2 [Actinidia eriantha]|nr:calcium uptake protein, mitochondrial-like isoform X2 [Actinidia eriantha]
MQSRFCLSPIRGRVISRLKTNPSSYFEMHTGERFSLSMKSALECKVLQKRYIFFVTILSIPESRFYVTFKMFDLDNNGEIDEEDLRR